MEALGTRRKLSGLIREGAKLHPQCRWSYFQDGKTCALGAAMVGAGVAPEDTCLKALTDTLEATIGYSLMHNRIDGETIFNLILGMNDHECRTREEIADWLEERGY